MKDIVVFLPSRDNPKKCSDTIDMLYHTCDSEDNFDIVCIIDDDQKEYGFTQNMKGQVLIIL
jgi:hypothetical protein